VTVNILGHYTKWQDCHTSCTSFHSSFAGNYK